MTKSPEDQHQTDSWPQDWPESWPAAAAAGSCLHCGNKLGKFWKPGDGPFCCRGCRSVWEMINQEDLCRYYDLRSGEHTPAANLRPESFGWLDRLLAEQDTSAEVLHLDLDIQGVHCAACVWLIEELFKRYTAGIQIRINPTLGKVELSWDSTCGDFKEFLTEVEKFGYRLGPSRRGDRRHARALLMRMAISISMAMNVMIFSLSYYFGLAPEDGALYSFFGWLSLSLATVSLIAGGGVFLKSAIAGLRIRILHLDVPISVGMVLAYCGSVYGFLTGGPEHAYFDSLTIFIALMLVGRWAQEHILERNRNALLDTTGAENLTAKRLHNNKLEPIAATEIRLGDELWIAPGDLVAVQGVLMRRNAEVSLDWITGESEQISFTPGEKIPAGAFNATDHGFTITAAEDFADSRLQDLLRATSSDEEFRPRWWHRISTWYVALVLIAAGTGLTGWLFVDPTVALKVTISILVVTCPCALGLATPLAEELVHVALRRAGIFLRKSDFLEKALQVQKIFLDKTGTLTLGQLILSSDSISALNNLSAQQREVLRHMTSRSNHPVSRCLTQALEKEIESPATKLSLASQEGEELAEIVGNGLELTLEGNIWRLGKATWAVNRQNFDSKTSSASKETIFTQNGTQIAAFSLSEEFKADAATEVQTLHESGYQIYLVSGDSQAKVDLAAAALNVPSERAWGNLSPEDKAERIRQLDKQDTLMVGDGLNDSPSFAAALCAATPAVDRPVLPGKADFYFLGDEISALRRSLLAARLLRRVVRDNLVFAIAYNVLAVGLCMAALVTPVVAAILMPVSSIFIVSWTALRLTGRRSKWT